jgi:pimeloyl-ACP methyl ester carboxylesterase
MIAQVNISDLARKVSVPTLVLHCKGDRVVPLEEGHRLAKMIPSANFVELPSNNHLLLEGTPEFDQFFDEVTAFLARHNTRSQYPTRTG